MKNLGVRVCVRTCVGVYVAFGGRMLFSLSKGGTEIVQAYDSCCVPRFCASIALAFILGVKLFDYVLDGRGGGDLPEPDWREGKPNGGHGIMMGGIKPSGRNDICRTNISLPTLGNYKQWARSFSGYD